MNTSSTVNLLVAFMFRIVFIASLLNYAQKRLIFIAFVSSGCLLSILWKKSTNSSNFLFLPSNIQVFVEVGFNIADVIDRCWNAILAIASANLLLEVLWSLDARLWVFSNISNVVSRDSFLIMFCGYVG